MFVKPAVFAILLIAVGSKCVAAADQKRNQSEGYDVDKFDEIYDQRQNGTENYIVTAKNVLMLLVPSLSNLFDVSLEDYPDLEDIFNPSADNATVAKPDNITIDLAQILFGPGYASPIPSSTTEHSPVKNETQSRR
nr:unnamed protein product [Callosobruchus chinensis]CAH7752360.1 unnamed protein product [Callosobruchus chinensis]